MNTRHHWRRCSMDWTGGARMPSSSGGEGVDRHIWLADQMVAEHDRIHVRAHETVEGFGWRAHDRLVANVKRRVQDDGNARETVEGLNQPVEPWIGGLGHGLDPGGAVDVGDRGNDSALRPDLRAEEHEGTRLIEIEVLARTFLEHGRRERPEPFAKLDLAADLIPPRSAPRLA